MTEMKTRIKDLSQELGVSNKEMLQTLRELDIPAKSLMSMIDDEQVQLIRQRLREHSKIMVREEVKPGKVVVRRRRKKDSGTSEKRSSVEEPEDLHEELEEDELIAEEETPEVESAAMDEVEPEAAEESGDFEKPRIVSPVASETEAPAVEEEPEAVSTGETETEIQSDDDAPSVATVVEPEAVSGEQQPEPETVVEETAADVTDPLETAPAEPQKEAKEEAVIIETPQAQETPPPASMPPAAPEDAEESTNDGQGKEEAPVKKKKKRKKKKEPVSEPQVRIISKPDVVPPKPAAAKPEPREESKAGPAPRRGTPPATTETTDDRSGKKKRRKDRRVVEFGQQEEGDRRTANLNLKKKKSAVVKDKTGGKAKPNRKKRHGFDDAHNEAHAQQTTQPLKAAKRKIKIDEAIRLSDLAHQMGIKAQALIKVLFGMGVMATINQSLDMDTATLVASEFGYEVEKVGFDEEEYMLPQHDDSPESLRPRPPVVTIMGHVDHGKTSLLDAFRKSNITDGEAGGITQHIGAYHVNTPKGDIVFLDTPGHEAFTAMRARGAQVTDIVVLVVAADDGVMDQTREAINHSKAAGVPIVVAVNKIDKEGADPDRVKRELADLGLLPEDWGGETIYAEVSAKKRIGLEEFLELILLQAEVLELNANPDKPARGRIVEAKVDKGRGAVATVLIQEGTIKQGEPFVCGLYNGRVRAMFTDQGKKVAEAGPSMPVEIQGFDGVPEAGDEFAVMPDEKVARRIADTRQAKQRERHLAKETKVTLEDFLSRRAGQAEAVILNLIVKADVQGSLEAVNDALNKLSTDEVKVDITHSGAGAITETDILLASASDAIIIGFNVRPTAKVKELAEHEKIEIRFYDIIYKLVSEIKDAMSGMLSPLIKENYLGQAEVRDTFNVPKIGTIAGCAVVDGKIIRHTGVRLLRDGVVIYTGKASSLKRFKDDAKEVVKGYECGIGLENYNDIKVGDVIEAFEEVEEARTLD